MEQSNKCASTASILLNILSPFVIPAVGFGILLNVIPGMELYSGKLKLILFMLVAMASCIIPLCFKCVLYYSMKNRPQHTSVMNHQILPYLLSAICIYLCAQFFGKLPILGIFKVFLFGYSLILILQFIIGTFWDISGHSTSIAALAGVLLGLALRYGFNLLWPLISVLLCAGIIGTLELLLDKHREDQVYTGYILGFTGMFALVMLI